MSLFLAFVLFFLSISTENYCSLLNSILEKSGTENSDSYFSIDITDFFLLNRPDEKSEVTVKNLPYSYSKNQIGDLLKTSLSPQSVLKSVNSGYISYSEILDRNLTDGDIVFPFHYFW